ncbi:MAG: paraquat-inducible protein A [Planctomycetota bacterium]|jgi:paraquat-inducible protein A
MDIPSEQPRETLRACPTCGLVQRVSELSSEERAHCERCNAVVLCGARRASGNRVTLACAIGALVIYPLAVSLPIMRLERFGHTTIASVWSGSVGLLRAGDFFVGGLVLVCSVILPLVKLSLLVLLCTSQSFSSKRRAGFYRAVELSGRWGMLDVLLVAVVVAWVKVGDLVEVTTGPAALAFSICVTLSLLASANFDHHALWTEPEWIGTEKD